MKRKQEERLANPMTTLCVLQIVYYKSFWRQGVANKKVQTPPGKDKSFVNDIYWMCNTKQDDYLSSLFGRAVMYENKIGQTFTVS